MHFKSGVSAITLILMAAWGQGAQAQATTQSEAVQQARADVFQLLSGFLALPRATYDQSLQVTIDFNNRSTTTRANQAYDDAYGFTTDFLGSKLSAIVDGGFRNKISAMSNLNLDEVYKNIDPISGDIKIRFMEIDTYGKIFGVVTPGVIYSGNPRSYKVTDQIILDSPFSDQARKSTIGAAFPSGHSFDGNVKSLLYAYMLPEIYGIMQQPHPKALR